jgi:hypothetical protein
MNTAGLKKKAKSGDPMAQYELGIRYMTGDEEIQKNRILGIGYLKKAAEQKHIGALRTLLSYYGDKRRNSYSPEKALLYVEELEKLGEKIDFKKKIQFRTKTTSKKGKDRKKRKKDTPQRDQRHKGLSSSTREKLNNILYGFGCIVAVAVLILVLIMLAKLEKMLFPSLHSFGFVLVYLAILSAIVFIVVVLNRIIHEKSQRKKWDEEKALWNKYVSEMEDIIEKNDSDQAKSLFYESLSHVSATSLFIRILVFQHYGNLLFDCNEDEICEKYQEVSKEGFLDFPSLCFPIADHTCYRSDFERRLIEYIYGLGSLFCGLSGETYDEDDWFSFAERHISNPNIPEKSYLYLNDNVFPGMNNSGKIALVYDFSDTTLDDSPALSLFDPPHAVYSEYDKSFVRIGRVKQYVENISKKEELKAHNGDANAQYFMGVKSIFAYGVGGFYSGYHYFADLREDDLPKYCEELNNFDPETCTYLYLYMAAKQGHKQAKGLVDLLLELEPSN